MEQPLKNRPSKTLRFADLGNRAKTPFSLAPSADERADLAQELGLSGIKKLTFEGEISPDGAKDWRLTAKLGATVVQPCVVTLDPVTTRIDEKTSRRFLAEMPEIDGVEIEMPDDDSIEELPNEIDLYDVLAESLSLAVPPFPRRADAEAVEISVSQPGVTPMSDADAKPFAGLGALKEALEKKGSDDS